LADLQSVFTFVCYSDELEQSERVAKYEKGHYCARQLLMPS